MGEHAGFGETVAAYLPVVIAGSLGIALLRLGRWLWPNSI